MSNLLDRASVVLTATAYNNGEALCIKPDDASGDFQFSRNSAATRVNAQGLVENVQILSSNLVQNGDFSELGAEEVSNGSFVNGETDWSFGTGWSVGENKAISDATQGYITQTNVGGAGVTATYKVQWTQNITAGTRLRFFARNYNDGGTITILSITRDDGVSMGGGNCIGSGTFTAYVSSTNGYSFKILAETGVEADITNISCKEVGQNWTFGTGFSIGENVAIYDDSANGNLLQSKTFTSGKKYNISFEIKSGSGSIAFLSSNGVTTYVGYATYGIGTHSVFFDYTTGSGFGIFASSFLGGAFSITNIKIIEITDDTNLPRINYENFSYQDVLGNELVVNGDFATDSNWSKDANWSIANGVATSTGVGRMFQSIPFLEGNIGTKVKVSFDITERISGGVKISCYGAASQILYTDVGTHTFIGTTTNSLNLYINNAGQGNLVGSIDNVSVKEYLGQEVVPDSGCGHWLFEPQSTNLITYSETYGSGTFFTGTSGSTIDNTTSISPSGEANATQVTSTGAGKIQSIAITTLSQNTDYAFSFYAKNVDATEVKSRVLAIGGSGGSGLTTVSYINEISTENWSRITHNFNTGTHTTFYLFMSNELNSGGTIQLWGAQLEQQSYATSYIPTEGTQTTRNSDVCTNGGSLASINSTEGVLYAEIAALENGGSVRIISLSDGTSDNIVQFRLDTNPNTLTSFLRGNGGSFAIKGITSVTQTDNNKIALVWNATNLIVWLNGVIAGTIATNDLPIGLNTLNFSNSVGSSNFFGKTKAVAVWKQALSDEELTELTTI